MRHPHLYCAKFEPGPATLSPEESHHAISALRLKRGDEVVLFDGAGRRAAAVVEGVRARRVEVLVHNVVAVPFELGRRLTIAVSFPRTHRQGYLIEKCTELGVAAIWPIISDRGVTRPMAGAVEKWVRRAIEAAKQSHRAWIPVIETPRTFRDSIADIARFDTAALADTTPAAMRLTHFVESTPVDGSMIVWIGPEGGWSAAEREIAIEAGALPVRLSPTVLRTETAAVAVCAAVAMASETSNNGMPESPD